MNDLLSTASVTGGSMDGGAATFRQHDDSPYIDTGANPKILPEPPYMLENNPVDWLVLSAIPNSKRKKKSVGVASTPAVKVSLFNGKATIYTNITRAYKALNVSPVKLLKMASVVGGSWFEPTKNSPCTYSFHIIIVTTETENVKKLSK